MRQAKSKELWQCLLIFPADTRGKYNINNSPKTIFWLKIPSYLRLLHITVYALKVLKPEWMWSTLREAEWTPALVTSLLNLIQKYKTY